MKILNLTQHPATPDQIAAGVIEPTDKKEVQTLLTFVGYGSTGQVSQLDRAKRLAMICQENDCQTAMIGGALFFMPPLERWLKQWGIKVLYSFTERVAVEIPDGHGDVQKTSVFRHVGWVEA